MNSQPDRADVAVQTANHVQAERRSTVLNAFLGGFIDRGRSLWDGKQDPLADLDLLALADVLMSGRGEASGVALASTLLERYKAAPHYDRLAFLHGLSRDFGPDADALAKASARYIADPSVPNAQDLHSAAAPRRRELFRRLNLAPGGTAALVAMREEILTRYKGDPDIKIVDADLLDLFKSWFNRGFLEVRSIDWSTPANILEKIIQYEAVHEIGGWDDLQRRTDPADRQCFAFFHPALADDPLIFVEVALTTGIASSVQTLLSADREIAQPHDVDTAIFYSISNCQVGLRGISFGSFLIKQVAVELKKQLPNVTRFSTLSPIPGFSRWLSDALQDDRANVAQFADPLEKLQDDTWIDNAEDIAALEAPLRSCAADYLMKAQNGRGQPLDPVARFHLGNGARLERINWLADTSPKGRAQSFGMMVNYLYDLPSIEQNHEQFAETGRVIASPAISKDLPRDKKRDT